MRVPQQRCVVSSLLMTGCVCISTFGMPDMQVAAVASQSFGAILAAYGTLL